MVIDEKIELARKRDYLVVKGNELIQRTRYNLSLTEQKTVAYICSMIKPIAAADRVKSTAAYQLEYEFNIRDYCKVCGIDYDNGNNYANIKTVLKGLRDKSMWLAMPDGSESLVGWLAKATTNKRSGIARVKLDEDLVPYLFDLGQRFTQYQLYNILAMKSAFSVRLYELLKSYEYKKVQTFDLDELKKLLMVEDVRSYNNFKDFRRKVLEKAQEEINELTDLNIEYEPITKGRKVVKVTFYINAKPAISRLLTEAAVSDRLDRHKDKGLSPEEQDEYERLVADAEQLELEFP